MAKPKLVNSNELIVLLAADYALVGTVEVGDGIHISRITEEQKAECSHWCCVKKDGKESSVYIKHKRK